VNVDRLRIQDGHAEEVRICMCRLPKGTSVGGSVCQRGVRCKRCKGIAVRGMSQSAEVRGRVRADTRQTLQQRKQAPRRARSAEGWRGQTVQQGAGMGSWHLRTRRCKKTRARSAQPCRGEKVQDAQLAEKRTGQRNSVQKTRAWEGRGRVRPVARDAGLLPSVQCGTRKCLRRRKAPVG
jgi:hypothetical protein